MKILNRSRRLLFLSVSIGASFIATSCFADDLDAALAKTTPEKMEAAIDSLVDFRAAANGFQIEKGDKSKVLNFLGRARASGGEDPFRGLAQRLKSKGVDQTKIDKLMQMLDLSSLNDPLAGKMPPSLRDPYSGKITPRDWKKNSDARLELNNHEDLDNLLKEILRENPKALDPKIKKRLPVAKLHVDKKNACDFHYPQKEIGKTAVSTSKPCDCLRLSIQEKAKDVTRLAYSCKAKNPNDRSTEFLINFNPASPLGATLVATGTIGGKIVNLPLSMGSIHGKDVPNYSVFMTEPTTEIPGKRTAVAPFEMVIDQQAATEEYVPPTAFLGSLPYDNAEGGWITNMRAAEMIAENAGEKLREFAARMAFGETTYDLKCDQYISGRTMDRFADRVTDVSRSKPLSRAEKEKNQTTEIQAMMNDLKAKGLIPGDSAETAGGTRLPAAKDLKNAEAK